MALTLERGIVGEWRLLTPIHPGPSVRYKQ